MSGQSTTLLAEHLEADFDALVDLDAAERRCALAQIAARDPERALALQRWLAAIGASAGLLESGNDAMSTPVRIGPWRLAGLLGRGGNGEVYLAHRADGAFDRQAALKLLRADRHRDAQIVAERRLLARLQHPNIASLLDGGASDDGRPYLVTEYIVGQPLDLWLRGTQPDFDLHMSIFSQLADAVAYAHAHGVVHADLKPANILIDAEGRTKLVDFGIAHLLGQDGASTESALSPLYAAPEQFDGGEPTPRTDVHALGTLLYLLLADQLPQDGADLTLAELKTIRQQTDPLPPSLRARAIPARRLRGDLDAIVLRCLARDPSKRYATVGDLQAEIRAWREHRPVAARHGGASYRFGRYLRRHWLPGLAAAAVFLGAAIATWQAWQTFAAQRHALAVSDVLSRLIAAGDLRYVRDPARETRAWLRGAVQRIRNSPVSPIVDTEVLVLLTDALLSHEEFAAANEALSLADARATADRRAPAAVDRARLHAELALAPLDVVQARAAIKQAIERLDGAPMPEALALVDARVLVREGRYDRAAAAFDRLIAARAAAHGAHDARTLAARLWRLQAQYVAHRYEDIERDGPALLLDVETHLPADHALLPPLLTTIALTERLHKSPQHPQLDIAEKRLQHALSIAQDLYGENSLAAINARDGLAQVSHARGNLGAWLAEQRKVLAAEQALFGEAALRPALTRFQVGMALALQGDLPSGEAQIVAAEKAIAANNDLSNLATVRTQHAMLVMRSDPARGLELAARADATLKRMESAPAQLQFHLDIFRIDALLRLGDAPAAQRLVAGAERLARRSDAESQWLLSALVRRAWVELALRDAAAAAATLARIERIAPSDEAAIGRLRAALDKLRQE